MLHARAFVCPLTCDIMDDPVVLSDGISYERRAAVEWCASCRHSPVTGEVLDSTIMVPNTVLRAAIAHWRQTPKCSADARAAELRAVRAECAELEAEHARAEHKLSCATERFDAMQSHMDAMRSFLYAFFVQESTGVTATATK